MKYVSFDGGTTIECEHEPIERYAQLDRDAGDFARIARGRGYSYVAASFGASARVLETSAFNRILCFAREEATIDVEPGVTLLDVYRVAAPAGLYLPVQPGYPLISVGGCIAANVHGKNPVRGGTFEDHVVELDLFDPRRGTLTLSRERNEELFSLTCGGLGLTGLIVRARLRLSRLAGARVQLDQEPVSSLVAGYERLREAASCCDIAYSWHSGHAPGDRFGRGMVVSGSILAGRPPTGREALHVRNITAHSRGIGLPPLWNRASVAVFNILYQLLVSQRRHRELHVFNAMFPLVDKVMYFHLFGRRGFYEFQALVPHERAPIFLEAVQRRLIDLHAPTVFTAMRMFAGRQQWLKFNGLGVALSLNLPRTTRTQRIMRELNALLPEHGAIPFVIKNSTLDVGTVAACYPEYSAFRAALRRYDPERLWRSELSERLGL